MALLVSPMWANTQVEIPEGARVYVVMTEEVIGKKKFTEVGQIVGCEVWRDVVIDRQVVIPAGASVLGRVDSIKSAKVSGIRGKTVDDQQIELTGGYMKAGKGRIALSAALAGPVFFVERLSSRSRSDAAVVQHVPRPDAGCKACPSIFYEGVTQ